MAMDTPYAQENKFDPYSLFANQFYSGQLIFGPPSFLETGKDCRMIIREVDKNKAGEIQNNVLNIINEFWRNNPKNSGEFFKAEIEKSSLYGTTLELSLKITLVSQPTPSDTLGYVPKKTDI